MTAATKLKDICSLERSNDKPRQHIKKQTILCQQRSVCMWELDNKKDWKPKNWCLQTVVLEKTLESPLDCMEIKSVNLKVNKPWIFTGRTNAEAEAPILWPPDGKSRLIGKDLDAGKDWRQEDKETTEDVLFGWHHWFKGHEFEQTLGDSEGQGSLCTCYSPLGHKELNSTERLNNGSKGIVDEHRETGKDESV